MDDLFAPRRVTRSTFNMHINADKTPACPRRTAFYVTVVCVSVLETVLLVGSGVGLQNRLVSLRSSVQEKERWLGELDLVLTADRFQQPEAGGPGRERRQGNDLLQALLTSQQNLFLNLCNSHSHLCRAGQKGEPGLSGPPGVPGQYGEVGAPDLPGDTGPNGTTGVQGPAGKTGPKGPTGDAGMSGTQGLKRDPGLLRSKGIMGKPGDVGAPGEFS